MKSGQNMTFETIRGLNVDQTGDSGSPYLLWFWLSDVLDILDILDILQIMNILDNLDILDILDIMHTLDILDPGHP